MDTKQKVMIVSLFLFLFSVELFSSQDIAQKDIPIKLSKPVYIKSENIDYENIKKEIIKEEFSLLKNSVVYRVFRDPSELILTKSSRAAASNITNPNANLIGKYLYAYTSKDAVEFMSSDLQKWNKKIEPVLLTKFRVILDKQRRVKFTDGSLIIKFNKNVNYSEFATLHNLVLLEEYQDINHAAFVHNDFNTLEEKISLLEDLNLVSDVSYNVIDPSVMPE